MAPWNENLKKHLNTPLFGTKIYRSTQKWGAISQYHGGKGLKFTFVDTHFGNFCEFFFIIGQLHISSYFKLDVEFTLNRA